MIEIPKLLILAQKRSGSHFLQDSIKCAALTGVTFMNYIKEGGADDPVDPNIYRLRNTDDLSVQFLRYHNFSTREDEMISWLTLSEYLINRAPKIVILQRKDRFMHALTDWFNDHVFEREVKRKKPHEDWTTYRERLIREHCVDVETFDLYFRKVNVFYKLFRALYVGYEEKCHHIYYEDFSDVASAVKSISAFAGFDVGIEGNYPVWQSADYSLMQGFQELQEMYSLTGGAS